MRIISLLPLLMIAFLLAVFVPACNNPAQPVKANTVPAETTTEPATFSASNLSIKPSDSSELCDILNIGTDEEIIISVTVTNTGNSQGSYDAILYIEEINAEDPENVIIISINTITKSMIIAEGESKKVIFDFLTLQDGIYTATIDELVDYFEVGC